MTLAAAIVSGLPLNVPTCSSSPAITPAIASSVPPIAPHGRPGAERLGEGDQVGLHAERLDRAAPRDREAGLHLVVGEHRAVRVADLLQAVEVAGVGQHHAAVRHDRLDDHAGDLVAALGEDLLRAPRGR